MLALSAALLAAPATAKPAPVIDMHLHALHADDQGPPPVTICAPYDTMPAQVHVDTGVIDYNQPRAGFWSYLKRLVDAGYGKRILYGSDQMVWPDAIPASLAAIEQAPFLTPTQKRDILHDNAARFLRLDQTR